MIRQLESMPVKLRLYDNNESYSKNMNVEYCDASLEINTYHYKQFCDACQSHSVRYDSRGSDRIIVFVFAIALVPPQFRGGII